MPVSRCRLVAPTDVSLHIALGSRNRDNGAWPSASDVRSASQGPLRWNARRCLLSVESHVAAERRMVRELQVHLSEDGADAERLALLRAGDD